MVANAKLIWKKVDGIKYFSNKIDPTDNYRLWESHTHPNYRHWMVDKNKTKSKNLFTN